MIIILLGIYLAVTKLIPYIYQKFIKIKERFSGMFNLNMVFLIVFIAITAYWVYHAFFIVEYSLNIFYENIGLSPKVPTYAQRIQLNTPIVTMRGNILYYGFFFFHLLFVFVLLIKLITRYYHQKIEDTSFTMFFFFCMFYGYLALYVFGTFIFPDRFLPFAWIFGIIPLTGFLLILRKNIFKKILYVVLISFIIFNLYNIDLEFYTGNYSEIEIISTEQDYLIAERINFTESYFGYQGVVSAIYDVQGIEQGRGEKYLDRLVSFVNSSIMAIINEDLYIKHLQNLKIKSREAYEDAIRIISYKNNKDINKICDFGNIYVLKGS